MRLSVALDIWTALRAVRRHNHQHGVINVVRHNLPPTHSIAEAHRGASLGSTKQKHTRDVDATIQPDDRHSQYLLSGNLVNPIARLSFQINHKNHPMIDSGRTNPGLPELQISFSTKNIIKFLSSLQLKALNA